jgi:hypothetical protein
MADGGLVFVLGAGWGGYEAIEYSMLNFQVRIIDS